MWEINRMIEGGASTHHTTHHTPIPNRAKADRGDHTPTNPTNPTYPHTPPPPHNPHIHTPTLIYLDVEGEHHARLDLLEGVPLGLGHEAGVEVGGEVFVEDLALTHLLGSLLLVIRWLGVCVVGWG